MATAQDIARFKGKYMSGWDVMREARFERQKKLGILAPDQRLPPREPNTYNWDKLTAKQRDDFDTMMVVYAAIISHMDRAIGRLMSELKSLGVLDDTLALLTSDNGANAEVGPDGILTGDHPGDAKSSVAAGMEWSTFQYAVPLLQAFCGRRRYLQPRSFAGRRASTAQRDPRQGDESSGGRHGDFAGRDGHAISENLQRP
jgi:arylsulfatase